MHNLVIIAITLSCGAISWAQQNAGSSVSPKLIKCYNDSSILEKDNRLPATMETLIALIRKIEDNAPFRNNRNLASQLLFSFRQDGIVRSKGADLPSKYGIPYSPKEWNAYRNMVLLKKIIPYISELDTNILTDLEQCSLHFFLSKAVEYKVRGDEQNVCNQLGKYRMRQRRHLSRAEQVEQFNSQTDTYSSCPVELGVVHTKWGEIFPGSVIAGLASGLNSQQIPMNGTSGTLDSKYAATIVGDLAEAAFYQISKTGGNSVHIGAEGNWNSTLEPKWYFVKSNQFLQMTDAEIRGDLDGLYLASSINDIKKVYQDIKVSQILDLYYSPRGVFNSSLRACNRKSLETFFTTTEKLIEQTTYFERLLDQVAILDSSIDPSKFKELAGLAVDSFNKYIPGNLNDPVCSQENNTLTRVVSDLTIFLDMDYEYEKIHPMLSNFLENIDVNKYETKFSLADAKTCQTLINASTSILDFHQKINKSITDGIQKGTDFGLILETIESLTISKLNNQSDAGGYSSVYLIITKAVPSENQKTFATSKVEEMKKKYPDTRVLILGVGQKTDYKDYVINTDSDVFIMPNTENRNNIETEAALKTKINEMVQRLKELPRSIINPKCGSLMNSDEKSSLSLLQYVEPTGQNVYRISHNYFYNSDENAKLRVSAEGGSVTVCISRIINIPNPANRSQDCKTINSDEYSHDIKGFCDDSFEDCEPLYISVIGETSYNKCFDGNCRFPDNIKFTVYLENVACASNGGESINNLNRLVVFIFISLFSYTSIV
ncbi:uncharacterized protein LOC123321735 [Coccinella septempunctata]|uniref:uncharacterized protein LOC123321735 n=1 Tax=Coccinella septempunctata TaxID=41139 RepID=UPI001D07BA29|nr:uncharacterized protein LOC123321735 [Coccinella septempunctata]